MIQRRQTEPQLSTYLHAQGHKHGLPISGTFELTARCNFDCPMCYVHLKQEDVNAQGQELTARQWIALGREARDRGMVFVLLTGGEPFVRKDFFEIYGELKKLGLLVSINSNGSMLSGEIRQRLLEDPPFRINISLYGGCQDTYRSMCGQDAFDRVIDNIRALKEGGIDVRLNLSITPYNCKDLKRIVAIAQELQVHVKGTSYMYPPVRRGGAYGSGNRLSPEEAAKWAVEWDLLRFSEEEFAQRAQAVSQLRSLEAPACLVETDEGIRCRAGTSSFWMTWDGRMLPCGMIPHPVAYPLESGFDAAWQTIRQETMAIRTGSQCASCPRRELCCVCAAACLTETGRFDGVPEYLCRMTDAIIEETQLAYERRKGI